MLSVTPPINSIYYYILITIEVIKIKQKINKVLINKNKSGIVNAIFFERNNFMKKSLYIYYDTILRNIKSFFSCMIMELKIAK